MWVEVMEGAVKTLSLVFIVAVIWAVVVDRPRTKGER